MTQMVSTSTNHLAPHPHTLRALRELYAMKNSGSVTRNMNSDEVPTVLDTSSLGRRALA